MDRTAALLEGLGHTLREDDLEPWTRTILDNGRGMTAGDLNVELQAARRGTRSRERGEVATATPVNPRSHYPPAQTRTDCPSGYSSQPTTPARTYSCA